MSILAALLVAVQVAPAPPPRVPPLVSGPRSEAYYEFLRGRFLEGEGQVEPAIEAFKNAARLDPDSADIPAELGALYARQNRSDDAIASAEAALARDPDNVEAHWVLGTVYAALAQGDSDRTRAELSDRAITHLEKSRVARKYDLGISLALGRLYLAKRDFQKAIDPLQFLIDQQINAPEVWLLLADAFDGAGRAADAEQVLRQLVTDEPRYFRAWVRLAELFEKDRRYADAADAYGNAVRQSPRNVEIRLRQASAWLTARRPASARDVLLGVVADAPTEAAALYMLVEAHRELKEYDQAEAAAKRLIALEPTRIRGAFALALVYDARRETRMVIETLEPRLRDASARVLANVPVMMRLALAYQDVGEFDKAQTLFEQVKGLRGNDSGMDAYLAQNLLEAKRPAAALELIGRARQQRPDDYTMARLEADALADSGRVDDAVSVLQREVVKTPDRVDVHLGLAALCVDRRRFDCAQTALDRADQRFPTNALVAFQRGAMFERQKRHAEAEAAFRQALARDPLHGPSLNYLGYMLAERRERLDEAVSLLERALETDPWNGSYLDSLGWAHFARGNLAQAEKYLSMAAERLPRNSVVQDHLGDLLFKQGAPDRAIVAWERSLQGDRESIDVAAINRKIADARRRTP
ncbi:MAG: tetratricopeptide repeat protein [Vicinamibacterales bacterium]